MIYECIYCEREYRFTNELPLGESVLGFCGEEGCLEKLVEDIEVPYTVLMEIMRLENEKK